VGRKLRYICEDYELLRAAWRQVAIGWIILQHDTKLHISHSFTTRIR